MAKSVVRGGAMYLSLIVFAHALIRLSNSSAAWLTA